MGEYGRVVGETTGATGGSGATGSGGVDVGGDLVAAASDAVQRVASLPPEMLLLAIVIIVGGLVILRRAV